MNDSTKVRLLSVGVVLLLLVMAGMVWKFVIAGSTEKSRDGRTAVLLAPAERDVVLQEMRDFLAGTQRIVSALAKDDSDGIANAARPLGMGMSHNVPPALFGKLPLEFKRLGFFVHADFDQLAQDAADLRLQKHSLEQLSAILDKCVACHSLYRLSSSKMPAQPER